MKNLIKKFAQLSVLMMLAFIICSFDNSSRPDYGTSSSSATVSISDISIESKDNAGRYIVKITVRASNLAADETIRTIGAEWGNVKSNPSNRDSRSSGTSATFTTTWHSGQTYYVTPFLKTNKTDGEINGQTKSKRTP